MSGAQRLGRGVYKLQGPAFLFNAIEGSKSETGKACKICTTLQRNTLCQNSENMVWTRDILPHWRHDSDSAWLEIWRVGARWDFQKARRKQDAVRVQGIFFVVGRFSAKASAPLLPISLLLRPMFAKFTLSLRDAAICCAPLSRTSCELIL